MEVVANNILNQVFLSETMPCVCQDVLVLTEQFLGDLLSHVLFNNPLKWEKWLVSAYICSTEWKKKFDLIFNDNDAKFLDVLLPAPTNFIN